MLNITGCISPPVTIDREHIFPPMPEPIVLGVDDFTNVYIGLCKDIEWFKWGLFAKLETGIIDQAKYDEKIKEANDTLERFDKVFQDYKDSLLE